MNYFGGLTPIWLKIQYSWPPEEFVFHTIKSFREVIIGLEIPPDIRKNFRNDF